LDALFLVLVVAGVVGALLAALAEALAPPPRHPLAAGEARDRQALRVSGRFDRGAALELRRRLVEDLRRHEAVRRHLESTGTKDRDREVTALLQLVDRSAQTTRDEIADVEMWLTLGR
jgi:hypothetical protein